MRGLYAIVDVDFLSGRRIPLLAFAERVIAARPAVVQLRAKHATPRDTLSLLRALRPWCTAEGVLLFANDRPDLAALAGCDGVHVGQDDLAVPDVRRVAPELLVGISTHSEAELAGALLERPAYVAFGPVFPTASKERPDPVVGLDGLARAATAAALARVPLVAIGGIDVARASLVRSHADLGAVLSALLPDEGLSRVDARVRELSAALTRD